MEGVFVSKTDGTVISVVELENDGIADSMDALSADGTGAIIDSEEIAVGAWEDIRSGCNEFFVIDNDGVVDGLLVGTNKEDKVGKSDGKIIGGNELLDCPC